METLDIDYLSTIFILKIKYINFDMINDSMIDPKPFLSNNTA